MEGERKEESENDRMAVVRQNRNVKINQTDQTK